MPNIGFMGLGNMGKALIKGWKDLESIDVFGYDIDSQKVASLQEEAGINAVGSLKELTDSSDYLVLAVKPYQLQEVLSEIKDDLRQDHCIVSIAAGVKREQILDWSGDRCPVVRVMPNTPALINQGVFALCLDDPRLDQKQQEFVQTLFAKSGKVHTLPEKYFDAFTALIGSGPAYVFYFLESLIEAGLTVGLNREESRDMVLSLVSGATQMAEEGSQSVSELREMVTSPAGTTIQGLNHLDRQCVKSAIIDAVTAACNRSKEMG